jgi:hypothetical protein
MIMANEVKEGQLVIQSAKLLVRGNFGGGNGQTDWIPAIHDDKIPFAHIGELREGHLYFYPMARDIVNIPCSQTVRPWEHS